MIDSINAHLANEQERGDDRPISLNDAILDVVRIQADSVALNNPASGHFVTYDTLFRQAHCLAGQLQQQGMSFDAPVGVYSDRTMAAHLAQLAIILAGGTYVPLDPDMPDERLRTIVEDASMDIILTEPQVKGQLARLAVKVLPIPNRPMTDVPCKAVPSLGQRGAYMIYTSGTSGKPKGTLLSHEAVLHFILDNHCLTAHSQCRTIQGSTLLFDAATLEIWNTWLHGGCLLVLTKQVMLDSRKLADALSRYQGTHLFLTTALFNLHAQMDASMFQNLEQLGFGGEAGDAETAWHVRQTAERAGNPTLALWNLYGPTETTVIVTGHTISQPDDPSRPLPLGHAMNHCRTVVTDPHFHEVEVGAVGELCIGGAVTARGYLGRPALTAEKFVPDPFGTGHGQRLYRSGDRVTKDLAGVLHFEGRIDQQVKLRGLRIEPGEIEAALNQLDNVATAVVAVGRDEQNERHLTAYLTADENQASNHQDASQTVRDALLTVLPAFMIPAAFVWLEQLPISANGKVDRKALPQPKAEHFLRSSFEAPINEREAAIAEVFAQVLGQSPISRHDHFFERGGHSLLAVRAMPLLRKAMHQELGMADFFKNGTPAQLAALHTEPKAAALPAIDAQPVAETLPLTNNQRRLWFIDQINQHTVAYNLPLQFTLHGTLSRSHFEAALAWVVNHHHSLCMLYGDDQGAPFARLGDGRIGLTVIEIAGLAQAQQARLLAEHIQRDGRRPFALDQGPLVRCYLFPDGPQSTQVVLNIHHIAADGWSVGILWGALSEAYRAFIHNAPPPSPPRLHIHDVAHWESKPAVRERQNMALKSVCARLESPPLWRLPRDPDTPDCPADWGARIPINFTPALQQRLARYGQTQGFTPYMLLASCFAMLLHRISGQNDVLFGTPAANRTQPETRDLIGFFANTLILRSTQTAKDTTHNLLESMREQTLAVFDHQDLPYDQLVQRLLPQRGNNDAALFQAMFAYFRGPVPDLTASGLQLNWPAADKGIAAFDLVLAVEDLSGHDFRAGLEFRLNQVATTSARRYADYFVNLLDGLLTQSETPVFAIPMLPAKERQQLLHDWNATRVPFFETEPTHNLVLRWSVSHPDALAICDDRSGLTRQVTYACLAQQVQHLAGVLRAQGIGCEDRVGLLMDGGLGLSVATLAVMLAGGTFLPLDRSHPEERLRYILEDAACHMVIYEDAPPQWTCQAPMVAMDQLIASETWAPWPMTLAQQTAYIIYTSGSTGRPKGTLLTHRGLNNLIGAQNLGFTMDHPLRTLQYASTAFDAAISEVFVTLGGGHTLVFAAKDDRLPGMDLANLLQRQCIGQVTLQPSGLAVMPRRSYPHLKRLITAGEACWSDLVNRWAPGRHYYNAYGPTETTVCASIGRASVDEDPVPIGTPITNFALYVVTPHGTLAPVGSPGELLIAGPGLARGYLARPAQTAERFVPNPFSQLPGSRAYRSGDLVRRMNDGRILYMERIDHQVKLRGYRIELGEIEACLNRQAQVDVAAVTVFGQAPQAQQLAGFIVCHPDHDHAEEKARTALLQNLRAELPEYMVPQRLLFLDQLPKAPTGKVDLVALRELAMTASGSEDHAAGRAPGNATESQLIRIFAELLNQSPDRFGMDSDFFRAGGHSLLAVRLAAALEKQFGVRLSIRDIFRAPTPAALLALMMDQTPATDKPPITPLPARDDNKWPLLAVTSFAQDGLWLTDQLDPGNPVYNIPMAFTLKGPLAAPAFEVAVDQLIADQESLRTHFQTQHGEPRQVIHAPHSAVLPVIDLQQLTPADKQRAQADILKMTCSLRFQLHRGPLFRFALLRSSVDHHVWVATAHHAIFDGWSVGVMLHQLDQYLRDAATPGAARTIHYADYAAWQRQQLHGEHAQDLRDFWQQTLAGANPTLDLPTDFPRPPRAENRGATVHFALDEGLSQAIHAFAQSHHTTPTAVFMAAFGWLLHLYSRQDDFCIGTPVANRGEPALQDLIGYLVNTTVIRQSFNGSPALSELVQATHEHMLDAFAHAELPFEQVVQMVDPDRDPSRNPLFQVMLVVQNAFQLPERLGHCDLKQQTMPFDLSHFDLTLGLQATTTGYKAYFRYARALFEAGTVANMSSHLTNILQLAIASPHTPLAELPLAETRGHAVPELARAELSGTMHGAVFAALAKAPDRIAVTQGSVHLSADRLAQQARAGAAQLLDQGLHAEGVVASILPPCPEAIVCMLATMAAGGVYLAVDPGLPKARLELLMQSSGARLAWTSQSTLAETCGVTPLSLPMRVATGAKVLPSVGGAQTAYLIFTSGSSGTPKAVCVPHHAGLVHQNNMVEVYELTAEDRFVQFSALGFDASLNQIFGALLSGACLLMRDADYWQAETFSDFCNRYQPSVLNMPPAFWSQWLSKIGTLRWQPCLITVGGDAMPARSAAICAQYFPQTRLLNVYGPTETIVTATAHEVNAQSQQRDPVAIGQPLPKRGAWIADRSMRPCPTGVPGELVLTGPLLARGYLQRPALTAQVFVPNPYTNEAGARLYRSGDLVRQTAGGGLAFMGRIDAQVKVRGFRIEPGEIETLLQTAPNVADAVTVVRHDQDSHAYLAAFVTAENPHQDLNAKQLAAFAAESLPAYMVPTRWQVLAEIPTNANGKWDRRALQAYPLDRHLSPEPSTTTAIHQDPNPLSQTAQLLAEIWQDLLQSGPITGADNFFHSGGHSLLAAKLLAAIETVFDVNLPLRDIFEAPRLMDMAARIDMCRTEPTHSETLPRIDASKPQPLSLDQERMWFASRDNSPIYNMPVLYTLTGPWSMPAVETSLLAVCRDHAMLRTRYFNGDAGPLQALTEPCPLMLPLVDLSGLPEEMALTTAQLLADQASRMLFDLQTGAVVRLAVFRLSLEQHMVNLTVHHIAADGFSMPLLRNAWNDRYIDVLTGTPAKQSVDTRYFALAVAQRKWLHTVAAAEALAHWRKRLTPLPERLRLPRDFERSTAGHNAAKFTFAFAPGLLESLVQSARDNNTTPFVVLNTALHTCLMRITDQTDVATGTPTTNRQTQARRHVIGVLVNTLVVRSGLNPAWSFNRALHEMQLRWQQDLIHGDMPFDRLVHELKPPRDPGRQPFFDVFFAYDDTRDQSQHLHGLPRHTHQVDLGMSPFDFYVYIRAEKAQLKGTLQYRSDLFTEATARRFAETCQTLFAALLSAPNHALGSHSLLSDSDRQLLLSEWNVQPQTLSQQHLIALYDQTRETFPDRTALEQNSDHLSYATLGRWSDAIAARLVAAGLGKEEPVGNFQDQGNAAVAAILGIMRAGGVYVPLDPAHPEERRRQLIKDTGIRVILSAADDLRPCEDYTGQTINVNRLIQASVTTALPRIDPQQLAYIIFTSGSTGKPKAVGVEHAAAVAHMEAAQTFYAMNTTSRMMQFNALNFDPSLEQIFVTLKIGGTLVNREEPAWNPVTFSQFLEKHYVDTIDLPPAFFAQWVAELDPHTDVPILARRLQTVALGGDALPGETVQRFRDKMQAPHIHVLNIYGPTETVISSTAYSVPIEDNCHGIMPIGRAAGARTALVVDAQLRLLPPGFTGELVMGGPLLARGYLDEPAKTAAQFVPDPWSHIPGGRLYRTGDRTAFDAFGELRFFGRMDNQVKLRGFRVELGEVESRLRSQDTIAAAAAVIRQEPQGEPYLAAYVVLVPTTDPATFDAAALRAQLGTQLPQAMVPSTIQAIDQLPVNLNGKVDRKALVNLPPVQPSTAQNQPSAPPTMLQALLAVIWQDLLDLPRLPQPSQDFFELGGHSLLAARLAGRLEREFGFRVPVKTLFDHRSILEQERWLTHMLLHERASRSAAPGSTAAPTPSDVPVPLAPSQQRLWLVDRMEPGNTAYNMVECYALQGPLALDLLETAIAGFAERHPAMTYRFTETDEETVQAPHPDCQPRLVVCDVSNLHSEQMHQLVLAMKQQPFDLEIGPLARFTVLKLNRTTHWVITAFHHIITDGWSQGLFAEETAKLYLAALLNHPVDLPEPTPYAAFAQEQTMKLRGEQREHLIDYWQKRLQGAPTVLDIPTDHPRQPYQTQTGASVHVSLSADTVAAIRAYALEQRTTVYTLLMSIYASFLARLARQNDVLIGTPVAGRNHARWEHCFGFFVNTLVVRATPQPNQPFAMLLTQLRDAIQSDFDHQDLPFDQVVEAVKPDRDTSRNTLFQAAFNLLHLDGEAWPLVGCQSDHLEIGALTTKYDLSLTLLDHDDQLAGIFLYNPDLFLAETVAIWSQLFSCLADALMRAPQQAWDRADWLNPSMRRSVLQQCLAPEQTTTGVVPADVVRQVNHWSDQEPSTVAVICGNQQITYGELRQRADALAYTLLTDELLPGQLVAIAIDRSPAMIVALLAVLKCGAAYLPLNTGDAVDRRQGVCEDAGVRHLIALADDHATQVPHNYLLDDVGNLLQAKPVPSRRLPEVDPCFPAYAIYTSGSTGKPKGVLVARQNVAAYVMGICQRLDFTKGLHFAMISTFAADLGNTCLFPSLVTGGCLHVYDRETATTPHQLRQALTENPVDVLKIVPSHLQALGSDGFAGLLPRQLLILGGEACDADLVAAVKRTDNPPQVFNHYGPSETCIGVCTFDTRQSTRLEAYPMGFPLANSHLVVSDAYAGMQPGPVPGELRIGGAQVAMGYLNRPALTAAVFVPDPFSNEPGARLYCSGDLVRRVDDGAIQFMGRIDHQVKIRGFRIELDEIRHHLSSHPAIVRSVVLALPDDNSQLRLVAYGECRQTPEPTVRELRSYLTERLPDYMVPADIVLLDSMPLNANGKLDRKALPQPSQNAKDAGGIHGTQSDQGSAPQTKLGRHLASIWCDILGTTQVALDDHFFRVGGHSLSATKLVSRFRQQFGIEIGVRTIFEKPHLVEHIDLITDALLNQDRLSSQVTHETDLEPVDRNKPLPLSISQERLWAIQRTTPDLSIYNVPRSFRISGHLNMDHLRLAMEALVARHEPLRTLFSDESGQAMQRIQNSIALPLEALDLRRNSTSEQELVARCQAEALRPFDLNDHVLWRVLVIHLAEDDHLLLMTLHHLISDGETAAVLHHDLWTGYTMAHHGQKATLPPLAIQYADFAVWQRQQAAQHGFENDLAFWREQLQGVPTHIELPTDYPRPDQASYGGFDISHTLSSEAAAKLYQLAESEQASPFMVFLSLFHVLLARYSGQPDVMVGTPSTHRDRTEWEGIAGFFVNTLVFAGRTAQPNSYREHLRNVRHAVLQGFTHRNLPFAALVADLNPPREKGRNPLYQTMFNYQVPGRRAYQAPGLHIRPWELSWQGAQLDLTLAVQPTDDRFRFIMEANADLFRQDTIQRMMQHLVVMATRFGQEPNQTITDYCLLTDSEQQRMLVDWNAANIPYASEENLATSVARIADEMPDAIAVWDMEGPVRYSELMMQVDRLSTTLVQQGAGPDVRVGVYCQRRTPIVVALLGILHCGATYVPLDPNYPEDRIQWIGQDAELHQVVTDDPAALAQTLPQATAIHLHHLPPVDEPIPTSAQGGKQVAYLIYTSGSTGKPKGVAIDHANAQAMIAWAHTTYNNEAAAGTVAATSICFDLSVYEIFATLTRGACVILVDNVLALPQHPAADRATLINTVPSAMTELLHMQAVPPSVTTVNLAGEPLPQELVDALYQLPHIQQVFNLYGPSEDTTYSTGIAVNAGNRPPIGRPIPNTQAYVLDRYLQPTPQGTPGQLFLSGAGVSQGYHQRAGLTAARYIPNPFSQQVGDRMYQTGDLVRYQPASENGVMDYLGRIDHQVKLRGFRIELGEIEAELRSCDHVDQALVDVTGSGAQRQLVAYVAAPSKADAADANAFRDNLRQALSAALPAYMVPAFIRILAAMPLTPNGKIDRKTLAAMPINDEPDSVMVHTEASFVAPRNEQETEVAAIWADVLGKTDIDVTVDFFTMGGHSLQAVRIAARLQEHYKIDLPIRLIFDHPTVEQTVHALYSVLMESQDEMQDVMAALDDIDMDMDGFDWG